MPSLLEHIVECSAVELSVWALESRVLPGQFGQPVLGEAEPELARLFVEHGTAKQLRQHLVVDAESRCLFARDALAELLRHDGDLAIIGETIFVDRHVGAARRNHRMWPAKPPASCPEMPQTAKLTTSSNSSAFGDPGSGGVSQNIEHDQFRFLRIFGCAEFETRQ